MIELGLPERLLIFTEPEWYLQTNMNSILLQGLSGSIPKGYNTPKGPTSKGLHKIPQIHQGFTDHQDGQKNKTRFQISPRRPSALPNSYIIAHSTIMFSKITKTVGAL